MPSLNASHLSSLGPACDDHESTLLSTDGNEESPGSSALTEVGIEPAASSEDSDEATSEEIIDESERSSVSNVSCGNHPKGHSRTIESNIVLDGLVESRMTLVNSESVATLLNNTSGCDEHVSLGEPCTEGILQLRNEAVESGMATVLDDDSLDSDIVFKKAVAFGKRAPVGPVFRHHRPRQLGVEKGKEKEQDGSYSGEKEDLVVIGTDAVSSGRDEKKSRKSKKLEGIKGDFLNAVPPGNLRVDELAKLLA